MVFYSRSPSPQCGISSDQYYYENKVHIYDAISSKCFLIIMHSLPLVKMVRDKL